MSKPQQAVEPASVDGPVRQGQPGREEAEQDRSPEQPSAEPSVANDLSPAAASSDSPLDGALMERYVSHEFRSHLNVVIGSAQLLARKLEPQDRPMRQLAASLEGSAALLLRLLDDWDRSADHRSRQFSFHCRWVEVVPWVAEWCTAYGAPGAAASKAGPVTPHLLLKAEAGVKVWVDPQRLSQCLFNLVTNAYKYGRSSAGVCIEVAQSGLEVRLAVIDDGRGLAPDQLDRLFTPFVRLDPDPHTPGQGLGLSLTRVLVQAMGGRIEVESIVDAGSRFTLVLRSA